ncbi:MAG: formate--tetrahydrofolate ligase [Planctomycetaceae bacterium]|nr:formate--tetrahydrofolate ligase [Planctomycetaceae bacterium]
MTSGSAIGDSAAALPISQVAAALGLKDEQFEPCGWHKAKLKLGLERELADRPAAKYIDVTAVSPTPLGEGKTVTTIGLAMALNRLGRPAIATLREPSMGPVFGIKGGGAGGGRATLLPADDVNLHFTGDIHAVSAATNLLAAMMDNHLKRGKSPVVDESTVTWRRSIDMNDRGLGRVITGIGDVPQAPLRETGFDLTAASEVMAILALATSLEDLRHRVGKILVGLTPGREPVFAEDIGCAGAMAALLRDAIRPNLVQTCENTPALVHAGPFGNIAHGNSSVLADLCATRLADFVITESGFGADCGAEKFFNIKCRTSGLRPDAEVLVCTVRALKMQSGRVKVRPGRPLPEELTTENIDMLTAGAVNLEAHIEIIRQFGVPVVVAVNRFPDDTDRELNAIQKIAQEAGAVATAVSDAFSTGGDGAQALAKAVVQAADQPSHFEFLYPLDLPLKEKIETIATRIYGAAGVDYSPLANRRLQLYSDLGYGKLPVCIAKTQYSLSHDPALMGRPTGFQFPIRDVRLASGAGFLFALSGDIRTMPGLPSEPAARRIDIDAAGNITGLT